MSPSLFALSSSAFALGFAEFGSISLVAVIASDTGLSLAAVGAMVGFYAFGVSIGAPALSAWLARAPRHAVALWGGFIWRCSRSSEDGARRRAQQNTRASTETLSGVNIAAFNVGIAAGSSLGGVAVVTSPQWPMLLGLIPLVIAMALPLLLRSPSTCPPFSVTSTTNQELENEPH